MKLIAPDYYNDFTCIAGACKHSCCIGWEIDIDDETYEYYNSVQGEFGDRLSSGIEIDDNVAHFVLTQNEHCPFLNNDNLCDIILRLGEDKLCDICREHPRFRNFYSDRTEVGLGLCCEAAAQLILTNNKKVGFVEIDNNGNELLAEEEREFFNMREDIIAIVQDRTLSIDDRINKLVGGYNIHFPEYSLAEWADLFLDLEHLDNTWIEKLHGLKKFDNISEPLFKDSSWEIAFEQLLVYYLYRHLPDSLYDGKIKARISFALLALHMLKSLCAAHYAKYGDVTITDFADLARCYSSEIEYSEDNTEILLDLL